MAVSYTHLDVYKRQERDLEKFVRVMRDGTVSMAVAGNILVIKTLSGMANGVAMAIDQHHFSEIVGSLAGDDTIFLSLIHIFVFPSFTQGTFYRENSIEFWIWKVVFKGRWNYAFRKINRRFFLTGYSLSGWSESLQMPRTGWESIRSFPTR